MFVIGFISIPFCLRWLSRILWWVELVESLSYGMVASTSVFCSPWREPLQRIQSFEHDAAFDGLWSLLKSVHVRASAMPYKHERL